jgi:tetratricopeptide (TPR) repeat protein
VSELNESESVVITAARRLLRDGGPMTVSALSEALDEDEETVLDELYGAPEDDLVPLVDDRWAHVPSLLAGRVFTHRLSSTEAAHDVIASCPDVETLLALPADLLRLTDGTSLELAFPRVTEGLERRGLPEKVLDPAGSVVLPQGTLSAHEAEEGDVIGLCVTRDGIELRHFGPAELAGHPGPVTEQLQQLLSAREPGLVETLLLTVCADIPEAFRDPLPPLTELFAQAGLVRDGDLVATAGFDFAEYRRTVHAAYLARAYQLTKGEALALASLLTLHRRLTETAASRIAPDSPFPEQAATTACTFLADPEVAEAFLNAAIGDQIDGAAALGLMVEVLEPKASRAVRPALRWLQARAFERLGRITEAEQALHAAERLGPDWPLVLADLARYASDRGDAVRGLALLRRASPYGDSDLEELLERFQPAPHPAIGRNEPCWCGSGRKFKQCHLHRTAEHPLEERAAWLYRKAGGYLSEGPWRDFVVAVAEERAAYTEDEEALEEAFRDPIVGDVVLFEGGAFAEFLEVRGDLLPADERLLAEQWLLVERSVFEVTAVRPGEGLTVRDLRTGDVHEVRERAGSRQLGSGQLICTRVVPAGTTMQILGGIEPIELHERDDLLTLLDSEPEPEQLVAFLSRRFSPPGLVNSDGDPIVLREVVLTPSRPEVLMAALDHTYRRVDGTDEPEWIHERFIDGMDRICATLRLAPDGLHIHANSDQRMDAVLSTIRALDPEAEVVSEERQPMPDVREAARLARERPRTGGQSVALDQEAPEVQEAIAKHIRDYEQQWLDLSIPVLGGLTPRQAASDPTRREDVIQLLASFPSEENPTMMSASRIRTALGLET